MKITIRDVAHHAKVSSGTVSNALTGKRPVAELTRNRILTSIEELGYTPDLFAQGLVNKRSHVVSIVITELRELGFYGYSSALTGIQRRANELGYSIMLNFVEGSTDKEIIASLDQIRARRSDGIIWTIHEIDGNRSWVKNIQSGNYPPIIFLHMHPDSSLNVISIDNITGASMAVNHLIAQGAKKIGIITGPLAWWESQDRLEGWRSTLQAAGIASDASLIVEGNWLAESGQKGMGVLLQRHPDLDAVFACNDSMALGALYTARSLGLSVPDDLLLVGYDDIPESASYWPPLTSVHQDLQQSGQNAVEALHQIIEADGEEKLSPTQQILQPRLIVRGSSTR
jgi:LacI family transcriptional regulator